MRGVARSLSCVVLLFAGYVLGASQFGGSRWLRAELQDETLPTAIRDRLRETNHAISDTMQVLQEEKRYVPAIAGINAFATSAGGVDAVADLESGHGVDPETFAGLYAGLALPEIAEHVGRDAEGHVTYKNKIIRIYSPTRMKQLFALRAELVPAGAAPSTKRPAAPKKEGDAAEKSE